MYPECAALYRECAGVDIHKYARIYQGLLADRLALRHGIAVNVGGGYHHAKPDAGEGFCIYNDIAIAVRDVQEDRLARTVLIVDLHVHQGNGTAVCLAAGEDVFTFDRHQRDIYPRHKEKNDLDVPLPAGTDDAAYMKLLQHHLPGASSGGMGAPQFQR